MPTHADIKRKNADFVNRAMAGKRTTRPSQSVKRRSVGKWVIGAMLFLLAGGAVIELVRILLGL